MKTGKTYHGEKRKRYTRHKNGVFFGFVSVILIIIAMILALTVFFKISHIEVQGDTRYTQEEVISATELRTGTNMFFFNKFTTIKKMFLKLPYLEEIQIRRHLPDTISITVKDATPVAVIEHENAYYVMDKKGKILEQLAGPSSAVSTVTGLDVVYPEVGSVVELTEPEKLKTLLSFLQAVEESGIASQIQSIDFSKVYDVEFRFMDRFNVSMGSAVDYEKKLRFLKTVVAQLEENAKGTIDVSDTTTVRFLPA